MVDSDSVRLREVSRVQRRPLAKPLQWYAENGPNRKRAMALAYVSGNYSMKEVAAWFGVHYSTVSRTVSVFETTEGPKKRTRGKE